MRWQPCPHHHAQSLVRAALAGVLKPFNCQEVELRTGTHWSGFAHHEDVTVSIGGLQVHHRARHTIARSGLPLPGLINLVGGMRDDHHGLAINSSLQPGGGRDRTRPSAFPQTET